jgi:hypothetical protein
MHAVDFLVDLISSMGKQWRRYQSMLVRAVVPLIQLYSSQVQRRNLGSQGQ